MEEQFIPYELALELRNLGFNEGCLTYYFIGGKMSNYFKKVHRNNGIIQTKPYKFHCAAPLWQQAFDFLEEEYNLTYNTEPQKYLGSKQNICFYALVEGEYLADKDGDDLLMFRSSKEAREACLEKLIEIVKK